MSETTKVAIWGASGHAVVVAGILELLAEYEVVGFLDDVNPQRRGKPFCGKTILGGREQLTLLKEENVNHIALAFGQCSARLKVGAFLEDRGITTLRVVHPNAVIAPGVQIGEGTVLEAGVIIDPDAKIDKYVILNKKATVSHDSVIEDGVHICPGVSVAGNVRVGRGSWVGIGSCVVEHVRIGAGSYIGAGSVVLKDVPDGVLAYGNPARVIRSIENPF